MVGVKIKQYLSDHGITQKFVADKAGIDEKIFSDICRGVRKVEVTEYFRICNALNLPLDYFNDNEGINEAE